MRRWQPRKVTGALQSPSIVLVGSAGNIVASPNLAKKQARQQRLIASIR
jgi:hypothetical protein